MKTELNTKVETFLNHYELEDMNYRSVQKYFSNLEETNRYGGILHALVHNKYDENKVLKLMEILMELGIDVNLRAKATGYTFIQLAIYGYNVAEEEYSYSTDYILKLIELAKNYRLKVNLIDNDCDTIIHTALASEIYTGKVVPLLKALGPTFDLKSKDNQERNIYEALLFYKQEAQNSKNKVWFTRLCEEELEIKEFIQKGNIDVTPKKEPFDNSITKMKVDEQKKQNNFSFKEMEQQLSDTKRKLDSIMKTLNIQIIFEQYEEIQRLIKKLELYLEKAIQSEQETSIDMNITTDYRLKIRKIITIYLDKLEKNFNLNDEELFLKILDSFSFHEERNRFQEIKKKYEKFISDLRKKIELCTTYLEIVEIETILDSLTNKEDKLNLSNLLNQKKQPLIDIMEQIKSIQKQIQLIYNISTSQSLSQSYISNSRIFNKLESMTIQELSEHYNEANEILFSLKKKIQSNLEQVIQKYFLLIENDIFAKEELWTTISLLFSDAIIEEKESNRVFPNFQQDSKKKIKKKETE